MICSRCGTEGIPNTAPGCPKCGLTFGDTDARSDPVSEELEQALRRELGSQYQITDLLGRGGMSLVYLAQEKELNRQVAIKVLPLQFVHGPAAAERFEREAKIAASLDHPHIVPIFRVGATSTFLWYTMKRIRGRSLEQVIAERGALPVSELLAIIEQVGSALQYAHRHGVVHRDVKPANVMIEDSGWALVCDFGVARAFGSVSLTQTGSSLGTPRYMSPEQFEGQPVDGRSDQYSLGIMTWEALTGAVPFTGDSLGELIRKHLLEPPPRVAEVNPDVPVPVSDAVYRAMSKKPGDRYPDIAAFVEALGGKAAPRRPTPFSGPVPIIRPSPPPRSRLSEALTIPIDQVRRRPVFAASVAVGVALAAGGLWFALKPTNTANGAAPVQQSAVDTPRTSGGGGGAAQPRDTQTTAAPPPAPRRATAPLTRSRPPVTPAKLSVSTQPWGQLFVDDQLIGNTPIADHTLTPGPHRVQVKRDGFVPFDTTFTAAAGQEIRWTRRTLQKIGG